MRTRIFLLSFLFFSLALYGQEVIVQDSTVITSTGATDLLVNLGNTTVEQGAKVTPVTLVGYSFAVLVLLFGLVMMWFAWRSERRHSKKIGERVFKLADLLAEVRLKLNRDVSRDQKLDDIGTEVSRMSAIVAQIQRHLK